MPSINDIRKANPSVYGNLTDYEIVDRLSQITGKHPDVIEYDLGVASRNAPGFTTALKSSVGSMVQGIGQLGADFIPGVGADNAVERYGREVTQRNPVTIMEGSGTALENIGTNLMEQPLNTIRQITGGAVGFMGPGGVAKVGLNAYRGLRGIQALEAVSTARKTAGMAGEAAYYGLPSYGQIRDVQESTGDNSFEAKLKAGLGSLAVGGIETFAGPEAALSRGIKNIGGAGKTFVRTGLKQGAFEAGEEIMQQPIEAWAKGENPLSASNVDQMLAGGAAGFLGGAPMGMVMHSFMKNARALASNERLDLVGQPAAFESTDQAQALNAANEFRMPDYIGQQVRVQGMPIQQWVDQLVGIGAKTTATKKDVQAAFNAKLDVPQVVLDANDKPYTTNSVADFLEFQRFGKTGRNANNKSAGTEETKPTEPLTLDTAKTRIKVKQFLTQEFEAGNITQEQHADATNVVDMAKGQPLIKIKTSVTGIIAPQEESAAAETTGKQAGTTPVTPVKLGIGDQIHLAETESTAHEGNLTELKLKAPVGITREATPEAVQQFKEATRDDLASALTAKQLQALAVKYGVRNEQDTDWEVVPHSTRAAAKGMGVDNTTVNEHADKGMKRLEKRAKDLGLSKDAAIRIMGLQGESAVDVPIYSEGQAAQLGLSYRSDTTKNDTTPLTESYRWDEPIGVNQDVEELDTTTENYTPTAMDSTRFTNAEEGQDEFGLAEVVPEEISSEGIDEARPEDLVTSKEDVLAQGANESVSDLAHQELGAAEEKSIQEDTAGYEQDFNLSANDYDDAKYVWQKFREEFVGDGIDVPAWEDIPASAFEKFAAAVKYHILTNPQGEKSLLQVRKAQVEATNAREQTTGSNEQANTGGGKQAEGANVRVSEKPSTAARRKTRSGKTEQVVRRSETLPVENPSDAVSMTALIKKLFLSPARFASKVMIVDDVNEIPADVRAEAQLSENDRTVQGFAWKNKVYLIAPNIEKGEELSVFLHELGAHVGLKNLLGEENFARLAKQISEWSARTDGSMETRIARLAVARMELAEQSAIERGEEFTDADRLHETIAYFVEEAVNMGINPIAVNEIESAGLRSWFRRFTTAMKIGLRKLGLGRFESLTAQNIVDLAYGAADLELSGTWHGTAADFRKFNHKYMGSGEGAQAYGWGTYLAQRRGIANEYFEQDVRRKTARSADLRVKANDVLGFSGNKSVKFVSGNSGFITSNAYVRVKNGKVYVQVLSGGDNVDYHPVNELNDSATNQPLFSQSEIDSIIQKIDAIAAERGIPQGALMRVRPLISESEMLDWDTSLDSQPEAVKAAIEKLPADIIERADDISRHGNATGEDLYRAIQEAADEGMFWKEAGVEDTGKREDAQKVASLYLDKLGVHGIKFLDQPSRQGRGQGVAALIAKADKLEDTLAELEAKPKSSINDMQIKALRLNIADIKAQIRQAQIASETRNIVVFNDKNISRTATLEGAAEDKVRFSKAAISKAVESVSNYTEEFVDSLPPGIGENVRYVWDATGNGLKKASWYSMFTSDLINVAKKVIPTAQRWYDQINAKAVDQIKREAEVDAIANESDKLSRDQFVRTWDLIMRMTGNQKWAYQPTWRDTVAIDQDYAQEYNELSEEEQALIDRVFKHGHETIKETQAILDQILNDEFQAKLDKAKTDEEKATILKQEKKFKDMFGRKLTELQGPYAPMRRVGSHVVVAKSQALLDAVDAKDNKLIEKLREDENHYAVLFFDSMAEAKRKERELKSQYASVRSAEKDRFTNEAQMLPFEAFDQIRKMASEKEGDVAGKLNNLITELYLTSLAETSSRKSELRREGKGIAGLNPDTMYKAFVSKGRASAHYIATLNNSKQVAESFAQMRQEARANTDMVIFNELAQRYANSVKYDPMPVAGKIMAFNTIWSLLTKPAYYLYNATQPALMTLPYFSQRFAYGKATAAMTQAYKDIAAAKGFISLKDATLHVESMPEDVRRALRDLLDSGKLDITITQDLGSRVSAGQGKLSRGMALVDKTLRTAAQKVETTNRLVTAIAAYRLAMGTPNMTHEGAVKYAAKAIDQTQGDYSNFNAPRLFNQTSFQRVITQFRKFQLIQVSFLVRMFKDATVGATKAERIAARRALGFVLAHHAVLAGALGLPAANIIAYAFSATGGDDEPKDLELELRKALGNDFMADLVTRGVPAAFLNVNVSNNVGMGQAFSLLPFTDIDFSSRDGYNAVLAGSMGPFIGGVGPQMWAAMGSFGRGDYYKGLEGVMPSGARTALKAFREGYEGVTNTRGDELVSPDEIALGETFAKLLGFKTNTDATRQLVRDKTYEFEKFFKDRTSELKNDYTKAYRNGDSDAMANIRNEWNEMNAAKRSYGFTVQPLSKLLKAPSERAKRERETVGGVQVKKSNVQFVESMVEEE